MTDTKTVRISVGITPDVLAMLDELVDISSLDRPAVIATLIQYAIDNPWSPFIRRNKDKQE